MMVIAIPAPVARGAASTFAPNLADLRARAQRQQRRQHWVAKIHALGARPLFELIAEIERRGLRGDALDRCLNRFAALDPDLLRALGADRLPACPTRLVPDTEAP
jgi:hypothetical protein